MTDPVVPLTSVQAVVEEAQAGHESYVMRFLVAADELANVAFGGRPDETISTDCALLARKHEFLGLMASRALNLFQPNHGADAAAGDLERARAEEARLAASGLVPR